MPLRGVPNGVYGYVMITLAETCLLAVSIADILKWNAVNGFGTFTYIMNSIKAESSSNFEPTLRS